jgi:Spy/CpxP family protein refolding chaperone
MNRLVTPVTSLALALCLLSWPAAAAAQGFKWWQSDRFQQELVLAAEQVTRLEEIFQALQPTLKTQKETLDKFEAKLSRVLNDARADEAMVLQAVERVEGARAELAKSRTLMMFRMNRILTSDQNVKMKALHEQWVRERRTRSPQRQHDSSSR